MGKLLEADSSTRTPMGESYAGWFATSQDSKQVLEELHRIVQSKFFVRSSRMVRFLRHLVTHALQDRSELLCEEAIASAVFDKPEPHDPRLDPIVRVEVSRLRKKLKRYYDSVDAYDSGAKHDSGAVRSRVRIELPQRTYVPRFVTGGRNGDGAAGDAATRNGANGASAERLRTSIGAAFQHPQAIPIAVLDLESSGDSPDLRLFAANLKAELLHLLRTRRIWNVYPDKAVSAGGAGFPANGQNDGKWPMRGYVIEGIVQALGHQLRVSAQLLEVSSGRVVWSGNFDIKHALTLGAQISIATYMAGEVEDAVIRTVLGGRSGESARVWA